MVREIYDVTFKWDTPPTYIQVHIHFSYTTLLILLGSLFPKTETNGRFFLRRQNNQDVNYCPHSFGHILHKNYLLKHVIDGKIGGRSDGKARKKR